ERRVRDELQLEREPLLLAVLALFRERWGAPCVGEETRVAAPALPAARREPFVAVTQQVGHEFAVRGAHDRSFRNVTDDIGAVLAVQLLALAVRARPGVAMRMVAKREERRDIAVRVKPDVAAFAAVTAIGSAARNVRFAPKRCTARAAVATGHVALRF